MSDRARIRKLSTADLNQTPIWLANQDYGGPAGTEIALKDQNSGGLGANAELFA